jgi:hypothetical protein
MDAAEVSSKIRSLQKRIAELETGPSTISAIDEGIRLRKEIAGVRAAYARSLGGSTFFIPWGAP